MLEKFLKHLDAELATLKTEGLYKEESSIVSSQNTSILVEDGQRYYNFCANNYLNLANDPRLMDAAKQGIDEFGYGMASVRFICGKQSIHQKLENKISEFLGTEDAILYSSCFDANTGLFETILGPNDAIISDALNHASIIDGVRLCKAKRYRYDNNNMDALKAQLESASKDVEGYLLIVTDGVFSMDGTIANLPEICKLAEEYKAMVMVDDSHAVGFWGPDGRGTPAYFGLSDKVDIYTGTLGKALGGASGGYVAAHKPIVSWLRQRSRPYLFSNSLMPAIVNASICALDLVQNLSDLRQKLLDNTFYFRKKLEEIGFDILGDTHPIVPIMIYDAVTAQKFASALYQEGVFVKAFSYPVVPQGKARIRLQMNAGFDISDLDAILAIFEKVGRELEIVS